MSLSIAERTSEGTRLTWEVVAEHEKEVTVLDRKSVELTKDIESDQIRAKKLKPDISRLTAEREQACSSLEKACTSSEKTSQEREGLNQTVLSLRAETKASLKTIAEQKSEMEGLQGEIEILAKAVKEEKDDLRKTLESPDSSAE
ncbi:uncharacterized protein RHO25_005519 [Cercospora beticola]|uniref:Uncharacterized protein n=1 Tax=Cercospora beticola TaxID=122368 RepID=A0ABZ0NMV1_CERBT|nr:hypothetical protein RHO25_005519 [Cercospora beticola]